MPRLYGYLATEGPHDLAVIGRLLGHHGMAAQRDFRQLDPLWRVLVPTVFPPRDRLLERVEVPTFFEGATHSIAVHATGGDSRLVATLIDSLQMLPRSGAELNGVGVLLDADTKESVAHRFVSIRDRLIGKGKPVPSHPGVVGATSPRWGIYVLPNNDREGTLEDVLLECAGRVYPRLLASATAFVHVASEIPMSKQDVRDLGKPAGMRKATAAAMASVLRPGNTIQVSIRDNDWISAGTRSLPLVAQLERFLTTLFDLV